MEDEVDFERECPTVDECTRAQLLELTSAVFHGECFLNEWEKQFVVSIHKHLTGGHRRPTDKQTKVLDRLLPSLWAYDPRVWPDDEENEIKSLEDTCLRLERASFKLNEPFLRYRPEEDEDEY